MKMQKEKIIIYTDGAARGNPGKAGWGVVFIISPSQTSPKGRSKEKIVEIGGRTAHATNNQMELTACIEALKYFKKEQKSRRVLDFIDFKIFSDSKYVILGITEWIFNWQKNNWKNAAKKPVLNKELWQDLYELAKDLKIKWHYVEGHSGDKWNERADEIATSFADNMAIDLRKDK